MLKRSKRVGLNQGYWHVVTGYLEAGETPLFRVKQEMLEETGIAKVKLKLVRAGRPFSWSDRRTGRTWIIHAFLFTTTVKRVVMNWEHTTYRWVTDAQIRKLHKLPGFRKNLTALRP